MVTFFHLARKQQTVSCCWAWINKRFLTYYSVHLVPSSRRRWWWFGENKRWGTLCRELPDVFHFVSSFFLKLSNLHAAVESSRGPDSDCAVTTSTPVGLFYCFSPGRQKWDDGLSRLPKRELQKTPLSARHVVKTQTVCFERVFCSSAYLNSTVSRQLLCSSRTIQLHFILQGFIIKWIYLLGISGSLSVYHADIAAPSSLSFNAAQNKVLLDSYKRIKSPHVWKLIRKQLSAFRNFI